jgi:hypothetical protein
MPVACARARPTHPTKCKYQCSSPFAILAQSIAWTSIMVLYNVYEAAFATKKGTQRWYIGCTLDPTQRELDLQKGGPKQPAWLRAGCQNFLFRILMADAPTKYAALALEALLTARRWRGNAQTRGGPWCRPTLSQCDLQELDTVSRCSSLEELFSVAKQFTRGSLHKHLCDLKYKPPPSKRLPLGAGVFTFRSLQVLEKTFSDAVLAGVTQKRKSGRSTRSGRSGVCGHIARKRKKLKYGSLSFAEAQWGSQPAVAKSLHKKSYTARLRAKKVRKVVMKSMKKKKP